MLQETTPTGGGGAAAVAAAEDPAPDAAARGEAAPQPPPPTHPPAPPLDLEAAILALLRARRPGVTCCPSEIPRRVAPGAWRGLMQATRDAAAALAGRGLLVVTQKGVPVDVRTARGPVRLGLLPAGRKGG